MSRLVVPLLAALGLSTMTVAMSQAQDAGGPAGDPERGRVVYRSVGYCGNCHGWAGDGKEGTALQKPVGANLRETAMDTQALTDTIACGIPGTPMPYHDRAAYRDGHCYGQSLADFVPGTEPQRGKTFSERDVANVVAYLQAYVIGRGEPTHEECVKFYNNPTAAACRRLE